MHYWHDYFVSFVGQLGWLDTDLPHAYFYMAVTMLFIAGLAAAVGMPPERTSTRSRFLIAGAILIGAAGVFGIQYLTWTVPGASIVEGVQGRYFLPLALPVVGLLPSIGGARYGRLHEKLVLAVLVFPAATLAVVMRAVGLRYYPN